MHDRAVQAARAVGDGHGLREAAFSALQEVGGALRVGDHAVGVGALDAREVAVLIAAGGGGDDVSVVAARAVGHGVRRRQLAVGTLHEVGLALVLVDSAVGVRAADALEGAGGSRAVRGQDDLALTALGPVGDATRRDVESVEALHVVVGAVRRVEHALLVGADQLVAGAHGRAAGLGDHLRAVQTLGAVRRGPRLREQSVVALDVVVGAGARDDRPAEVCTAHAVEVAGGGAGGGDHLLVVDALGAVGGGARLGVGAELTLHVVVGTGAGGERAVRRGAPDAREVALVLGAGTLRAGNQIAVGAALAGAHVLHRAELPVRAGLVELRAAVGHGAARAVRAAARAGGAGGGAGGGQDQFSVLAARSRGHCLGVGVGAVVALLEVARAGVRQHRAVGVRAHDAVAGALGARAGGGQHQLVVVAARAVGHGLCGGVGAVGALHEVGGAGVGDDSAGGVGAADALEGADGVGAGALDHQLVLVALRALGNGDGVGESAVVALHEVARAVRVHEGTRAVGALDVGEGAGRRGAVRVQHEVPVQALRAGRHGHHLAERSRIALAVVGGARPGRGHALLVGALHLSVHASVHGKSAGRSSDNHVVTAARQIRVVHLDGRRLDLALCAERVVLGARISDPVSGAVHATRSLVVTAYALLVAAKGTDQTGHCDMQKDCE